MNVKIFPWKELDIKTMKTEGNSVIISASLAEGAEAKIFRFEKEKNLKEVYDEILKTLKSFKN